jgi:non-homologous end joining protein Ku
MARAAWTGAINFAGFPIHLCAYNVLRSKSADSFKTLAPSGEPVKQVYVDANGEVVDRAECLKGVEVGKDKWRALPPEAVEAITEAERSVTLEPASFSERESVPLHLATGHFRLVPNTKIPGAEGPAGILWNGLRSSGRVLVTEWTPRSGSRTAILVVHADADGLNANTLPYATDFNDVPEHAFEVNEQAEAMFGQFVEQNYALDDFSLEAFEDRYSKRRQEIIAKALAGEEIEVAELAPTAAPAPDLMAAMAASISGAKAKKSKTGTKKPAKSAA